MKLSSVKGSELNAGLIHGCLQVPTNREIRQTCPVHRNLPLRTSCTRPGRRLLCLSSLCSEFVWPHKVNLARVPPPAGCGPANAKVPHAFKHRDLKQRSLLPSPAALTVGCCSLNVRALQILQNHSTGGPGLIRSAPGSDFQY